MLQPSRMAPFIVTAAIAVFLQLIFIYADIQDTPTRAVTEFTKAYFAGDRSMSDRFCEKSIRINGVDVVDEYVYRKQREAAERGFSTFYLHDSVHDLRAHIISQDATSAEVRVTGKAKPILKGFFTKEKAVEIDETLRLTNENGRWKVCGNAFSLANR